MEHHVGLLGELNAVRLPHRARIEQAQLNLLGMLGKERKVHAFSIPGGAQRIRFTRPDDTELLTCHLANSSLVVSLCIFKNNGDTAPAPWKLLAGPMVVLVIGHLECLHSKLLRTRCFRIYSEPCI